MVDSQDTHDVLGRMAARMRWRCDDPRAIEAWRPDVRLDESCTFVQLPPALRRRLPRSTRLLLGLLGRVRRRDMEAYRFNLFSCGG
ncbi:hypothetical protein ACH4TV_21370 [Streptomyces sp. NPDC020898]|uniref:hypothetical protein n=1 Tax=Streptomyces sp. NPDC020898 TaxID=3365101 RepID=UPI0037A914F1